MALCLVVLIVGGAGCSAPIKERLMLPSHLGNGNCPHLEETTKKGWAVNAPYAEVIKG